MKKLIIGLLVLMSCSAFATDTFQCDIKMYITNTGKSFDLKVNTAATKDCSFYVKNETENFLILMSNPNKQEPTLSSRLIINKADSTGKMTMFDSQEGDIGEGEGSCIKQG